MIRKYSVLGGCIAVSVLFLWSAQSYAVGNNPPRPGPGAIPASANAPVPQQERWATSFDIRGTNHAVFNFTVGAPGKITVNIQSQGDPVNRFLVKPSGEALPINNPAAFEYVVTAEDIGKGKQWKVDIYLAVRSPAQGSAGFNPNMRANGGITILHPPSGGNVPQAGAGSNQSANSVAAGPAAAHVTDQTLTMAPVAFARPMLARRNGELTFAPIDISNRFEQAQHPPVNYRPFTLADVFNLQTGKPLFAVDENTAELPLQHKNAIKVFRGVQSDASELQRRGGNAFRVGHGGTFRLWVEAGRQVVTVPRGDGTSITVPAEVFLRELNSYEQGLSARGISLRDGGTGKIAAAPRELTVSRLHVDTFLIKQQHIDHERRIVKDVAPRSWESGEIFQRHQKAMANIPAVMRGPNNRLISASLPANAVRGRPHFPASGNNSAAGGNRVLPGNMSDKLGNRVNPPAGTARGAMTDGWQKCALALDAASQPDGGAAGDVVTINVAKYDAGACVVSMNDAQGRQVDIPSVNQISATQLSVTVPAGLKGMGSIVLRSKSSPAMTSTPFYIGPECSVDSAYPPTGMADTELLLKVGRFKNCDLHFADGFAGKSAVTFTVVDGGTIQTKVPNFTIGNDRIEAARHPSHLGEVQHVTSTLDFTIQRTVADQNGNAPPPDYFARGIQPFERKYEWKQQYGDPSSFAVDVFADLTIYSDGKTPKQGRPTGGDTGDNQVIFLGEGGAAGWLFNNRADIIVAHAIASVPTATSKDSKLRVNFNVDAGGVTIYRWKKNKDKDKEDIASEAQNVCPDDQKVGGRCCDDIKPDKTCADDGAAFQAQIKYEHEYPLLNVDQSVSTNFPVGPVPMVARFGFHGEAGAHVRFALSPLQAIAQVKPHANVRVYGECGVTILFATAGVGADLVLADVTLDAAGSVYLDFGQMALVANMYVNYDYVLLDGTVYVFIDGFGNRVKQNIFDVNDLASQVSGQNLVFKGKNYLLAPQTYTMPLLTGL